jgi:hypothetical protein
LPPIQGTRIEDESPIVFRIIILVSGTTLRFPRFAFHASLSTLRFPVSGWACAVVHAHVVRATMASTISSPARFARVFFADALLVPDRARRLSKVS